MNSIKKIILVFKTHLDVGFTDFAEAVTRKYMTMFIPNAIKVAESLRLRGGDERFVWTTGSWLIEKYLREADSDGALDRAIKNGDISWHGLPFTMHTEFMNADMFRYGLSLSKTLDERYGKKTISAKLSDVPGHTRAMIPYLCEAGIEFLHIGVNSASTVPNIPDIFKWRDINGDEITVMYNAGGYGNFCVIPGTDTAVCFAHTGDNLGPQSPEAIIDIFKKFREKYPEATIVAGDINDIALEIRNASGSLPVVTSEIGDTWIHGVGSQPRKVSGYRAMLRQLPELNTESREKAMRSLLLVAEHTWGLDVKTWLKDHNNYRRVDFEAVRGNENYRNMEASWAEQLGYVQKAAELLDSSDREKADNELKAYKRAYPDFNSYIKIDDINNIISINDYKIRFNENGGINYLEKNGAVIADENHIIGEFIYQAFSKQDYDVFYKRYNTDDVEWAVEDFTKPGIDGGIDAHREYKPILKGVWSTGDGIMAELELPEEASELFGEPKKLGLYVRFDKNYIELDFCWWQKPACRVAEALWLGMNPISANPSVRKLGSFISPMDVVERGGRKLHASDWGVKFDNLSIESLDAALVNFGYPEPLAFDGKLPALEQGIFFNLYNNLWGTNFGMWYDEDARFRFLLRYDGK